QVRAAHARAEFATGQLEIGAKCTLATCASIAHSAASRISTNTKQMPVAIRGRHEMMGRALRRENARPKLRRGIVHLCFAIVTMTIRFLGPAASSLSDQESRPS